MVLMTVSHDGFTAEDLGWLPGKPGAKHELYDGVYVLTPQGDEAFTAADLAAFPEIPGAKHELLDGVIVVSPPGPSNRHEGILGNLHLMLRDAVGSDSRVRLSRFEVTLPGHVRIQPDLLVARKDDITDRGVVGPPTLVVEILSPRTRLFDLHTKRDLLEEAGCPSYWLIEPGSATTSPTLTVLELTDGRYVEVATVTGAESWTATRPFGVTIVPDELVDD